MRPGAIVKRCAAARPPQIDKPPRAAHPVPGPDSAKPRRQGRERMADKRDVVIVGAGPVGFILALGLARQGVDVTLIDGEKGIVNSPRAAIYHPVTLELLDRLGVIDDCMAIAFRCESLSMRYPEVDEVI